MNILENSHINNHPELQCECEVRTQKMMSTKQNRSIPHYQYKAAQSPKLHEEQEKDHNAKREFLLLYNRLIQSTNSR